MSGLALGLVLCSAVMHAVWNLLLKGQSGKLPFTAAALAAALAVFAVPFVRAVAAEGIPPAAVPWILLTGGVHVVYFHCLARTYDVGDLSFAYPLARGGAALLVPLLAVPLLGERPSPVGAAGIAVIVMGLALLHGGDVWRRRVPAAALAWGLATAATIGAYTLVDKVGVGHAPPLVYWYLGTAVTAAGLWSAVAARRELGEVRALGSRWPQAAAMGTMVFATYILVLYALRLAPAMYVYPARQVGLAFGVVLGALARREPALPRRLTAALVIAAGTALLGAG